MLHVALREVRQMHDTNVLELAHVINRTPIYLSGIEAATIPLSLEDVNCYATAFRISIADIFAVAHYLATGSLPILHPKIDAMVKLLATVRVMCPDRE